MGESYLSAEMQPTGPMEKWKKVMITIKNLLMSQILALNNL